MKTLSLVINVVRGRFKSFGYAFNGLKVLFRTQANARIHLLATITVIACGIWFHISSTQWALLFLCIGLVLAAEVFNTAIEFLVDFVSPQHHQLAGKIKDLAAAGVVVAAGTAVLVGLVVFLPRLIEVFNNY